MTANEAITFVREHGVVLVSGKGPVPRLVEAIVGEPVKGSWWAHSRSHEVFAILQAVTAVRQQHTESGRHVNSETAFPKWVPAEVRKCSKDLLEEDAMRALGPWLSKR